MTKQQKYIFLFVGIVFIAMIFASNDLGWLGVSLLIGSFGYFIYKKDNEIKAQPIDSNTETENLNLFNCKDCGNLISKNAITCPHCGAPVKKIIQTESPKNYSIGSLLMWVLILGVVSAIVIPKTSTTQETPQETAQKEAESQRRDTEFNKAYAGKQILLKAVRDQDSLEIDSTLVMDNMAVCYEYRAKNGFGGVNRGSAVYSSDGLKFITNEMDGFDKQWKKDCANKSGSEIHL